MSLPSSLTLTNLYNNPQLLGQLFPSINVQAIQSAFQAEQVAAQQPLTQISQQLSSLSAPLQAWQALQTDLQTLQSDATNLAGANLYQGVTPTSSDTAAVTATTTGATGSAGTYTIGPASGQTGIVLAQDEIVNSASQSSDTSALNQSGSFTIDGKTVSVSSSDSLQSIASSINAAGAGVSAVVLAPPGGGYVLSLQGATAGPITLTDPNGILQSLGVLNGSGSPNVVQNYQYAQYNVDGVDVTQGTTNTDTTSIPGVSFTLLGTTGATITVAQNTSSIQTAVQKFVSDYNNFLSDSQKYAGKGGAIEGDGTIGVIGAQLMQILTSAVAGQPSTLDSLGQAGISLSAPVGSPDQFSLSVDSTTLQSTLQADPGSFASLWNGSGGIATQIEGVLNAALGSNGGVTQSIANLQQEQSTLQTDLSSSTSVVNQTVNNQLQSLQQQFDSLMQSLVSLSGQGSMITSFINQLSGQSSQSSSSGSTSGG